jgi:signal transduction histidine kinase
LQDSIVDKFGEIKQLTDQMIQTVQEIASDMRPSVLDNLGLSSAIRFESGRFQKRTGIVCEIEIMASAPLLAPARSTGVFRIFQEILTNIARHATATRVHIRLAEIGASSAAGGPDNGRGITSSQLADDASLGLLGMRERAAQIGAEIRFIGEPGQGTTVTLELPL